MFSKQCILMKGWHAFSIGIMLAYSVYARRKVMHSIYYDNLCLLVHMLMDGSCSFGMVKYPKGRTID